MTKTIFVTGGTDGCGVSIARALADAGHTVYVGMEQASLPAEPGDALAASRPGGAAAQVRTVALETVDQHSITGAVRRIEAEAGPIEVVIHTTAPLTMGPAESFTPFQLSQVYDLAVLSAQRVSRAVLPLMRERGEGLLIWTAPAVQAEPEPFAGPGRAVGAALGQLAESYAAELAPFGIDVTLLTHGADRLRSPGAPEPLLPRDTSTADAYALPQKTVAPGSGVRGQQATEWDAHLEHVAQSIVGIVESGTGTRPVRLAVQ